LESPGPNLRVRIRGHGKHPRNNYMQIGIRNVRTARSLGRVFK